MLFTYTSVMLARTTEYAIRALVYIEIKRLKGERPGFREIAKEIDSPEHFTAKIMQTLTRHGIVESAKGRGGGFFFTDAPTISIFSVIKAMEGERIFQRCGLGLKNCDDLHPCPLHNEYAGIRQAYLDLVTNTSISDLAKKINDGEAVLSRLSVTS